MRRTPSLNPATPAATHRSPQDELVATEMVFSGVLSDLTPAEAVALLSALVFQEKSDVEPVLNEALAAARADLTALTLQVRPGVGRRGIVDLRHLPLPAPC
jgi:antiviral helicase SKI2